MSYPDTRRRPTICYSLCSGGLFMMNLRGAVAVLLVLWVVHLTRPAHSAAQPIEQNQADAGADRKANLEAFLKDAQTYEITM